MNQLTEDNEMKREELERMINDAADGVLDSAQIGILEKELEHYPDLYQNYLEIMALPELTKAFGHNTDKFRNDFHMLRIHELLQKEMKQTPSFEEVTVLWFKKYALAAAVLIIGMTSVVNLFLPQLNTGQYEMALPELFYPFEESSVEEYVVYLEELIEQ